MKKSIMLLLMCACLAFDGCNVFAADSGNGVVISSNGDNIADLVPLACEDDTVYFEDEPKTGTELQTSLDDTAPDDPSDAVEIDDYAVEEFDAENKLTIGNSANEDANADKAIDAVYADAKRTDSPEPVSTDIKAYECEGEIAVDGQLNAFATAPKVSMSFDNINSYQASVNQEFRLNLTMDVDMAYLYILRDNELNGKFELNKNANSTNTNDYSMIISFPCKGTYKLYVDVCKDGQWYTGDASAVSVYVGDTPEAYYMELDRKEVYAGDEARLNVNIKNATSAVLYVERDNTVVMSKAVSGSVKIKFPTAGTYKLYMKTYNTHGTFDGKAGLALTIKVTSRITSPYTLSTSSSKSLLPGEGMVLNYNTKNNNGWLCISRDGHRFAEHALKGYQGKCTVKLGDEFTPGDYVCYMVIKSGSDVYSGRYVKGKRIEFTVKNPQNIAKYSITASSTNVAVNEGFDVVVNGVNAEKAKIYLIDSNGNQKASFNSSCNAEGRCSVNIRISTEGVYRLYAVTEKADGTVRTFDGSPSANNVCLEINVKDTTAFTFEKNNFFYKNDLYSCGYDASNPPVLSIKRYVEALDSVYGVAIHNNADTVKGFGYGMCAVAALVRDGRFVLSNFDSTYPSFLHGVGMPGSKQTSQIRDLVERLQLVQMHPNLATERNSNKNSAVKLLSALQSQNKAGAGIIINLSGADADYSLLALSVSVSKGVAQINVYNPSNRDNRDDYAYLSIVKGAITYNGVDYKNFSYNLVDTVYTTLNKKDKSDYTTSSGLYAYAVDDSSEIDSEIDMNDSILFSINADVFSIVRASDGVSIAQLDDVFEYSGVEDCSNKKTHYYILPKDRYIAYFNNCRERVGIAAVSSAMATINTSVNTLSGKLVFGCEAGTDSVYCNSGSDKPADIYISARNTMCDTQEFFAENTTSLSVMAVDESSYSVMSTASQIKHNNERLTLFSVSDDNFIFDGGSTDGTLVYDNIDDYFDGVGLMAMGNTADYPCEMDAEFDLDKTDGIVNGTVGVIASNPDDAFKAVKVYISLFDSDNRFLGSVEKDAVLGSGNTYIPVEVNDIYAYSNEQVVAKVFLWDDDMQALAYHVSSVIN